MRPMGASANGRSLLASSAFRLYGALLVILLLGSAVRFHRLGAQSFWYDEGVAYAHSLRTLPELIPLLQRNVHVPAYFAALGVWQDFTGSSEFALRALSALFSVISIAWAYALGKRLFHPVAAVAAAALVALNSFSIYYAQEARMYAMLAAIAGASMWLFAGFMRAQSGAEPARRRLTLVVALGLTNTLGIYTHVAFALVILTQLALAVICFGPSLLAGRLSRRLIELALANLLTLLLFLPWLPVSLAQISAQPNLAQSLPLTEMLRLQFGRLIYGNAFELAPQGLGFVAGVFLLFGLLPAAGSRPRAKLFLPLIWVLISLALYLSLDLSNRYLRFLLPAQIGMALWLGRGVWLLWSLPAGGAKRWLRRLPRLAALVALSAYLITQFSGLETLFQHPEFQRDDMRALIGRIQSDLRDGDALIVSAAGLQELLRYYYRGAAPVFALPTSADEAATRAQVLAIVAAHDRLHVIFYGAAEQDPNLVVETTLNANAFEVSDTWVDELRYVAYAGSRALAMPVAVEREFGAIIRLHSYRLQSDSIAAGAILRVQFVWSALEKLDPRYKVFLQLLDAEGVLVAQRDSEPGGGSALTRSWAPGEPVLDNHGLLIPNDLPAGEYRLIAGLYDRNDPGARLELDGENALELGRILVE